MDSNPSSSVNPLQRRRLLGLGALSALSLAAPGVWAQPLPGSLNNGRLIVVFLRGAYDGLSAFVPYADKDYYALRPNIAIAAPDGTAQTALKLDNTFALHPALAPLLPQRQVSARPLQRARLPWADRKSVV